MSPSDASLRTIDAAAREKARTVFDKPVVIEAGAGTGKTTILVNRVIAWCLGPGWDERLADRAGTEASNEEIAGRVCERVVAITFTKPAAAEMAQRIGEVLADIERGKSERGAEMEGIAETEEVALRARALLGQVHRLRVSTIHSFCTWVMRRYPVESGVDPAFTVDADGLLVAATVQEVIEDDLRRASEGASFGPWQVLVRAGQTPSRVATVLARLVYKGLDAGHLEAASFTDEVATELASRFDAACRAVDEITFGRLDEARGISRAQTVARLTHDAVVFLDSIDPGTGPLERLGLLCDLSASLFPDLGARLKDWAGGTIGKKEADYLAETAQSLPAAAKAFAEILNHLRRIRPREYGAAVELLKPLITEARRRLRARGVVTYDDLLEGAYNTINDHPEVKADIRRGISQLLVDEFQDTDRAQCEIVWLLAMGDEDEAGDRPGLFIVGDPKQSIYGWRSADLEAYMGFVERVRNREALVYPLAVNFRSVPAVLREVERVVSTVMVEEPGLQPPFQQLLAWSKNQGMPGFTAGGRAPVEYWLNCPEDPETGEPKSKATVDEAAELEADAVAEDMLDLHDNHGVAWSSIGVLMRTNTKLKILLDSFRRHRVPFEVAKDREYYKQREVVEAAALARAVMDPGDQLALLTVLRSDVVGVPDSALQPLWDRGLPSLLFDLGGPNPETLREAEEMVRSVAGELPAAAPGLGRVPRWTSALLTAVETLAVLRESVRRDPAAVFVERMRSLWLAEISAAARYLGRHRLGRLEAFYADLERYLAARGGGPRWVARLLRQAVAGEQEAQGATTPDSTGDAVAVMTIHGAKGLDFEHVYVINMAGASGGGSSSLAEALPTEHGVELSLFGWAGPGIAEAEERVRRREAAELVRLLYVAMTRAKQRLVLSAMWKPGAKCKAKQMTLKGLLEARCADEAMSALTADRLWRALLPGDDALWVQSALREGWQAAPSRDTGSSPAPDRRLLAEHADRLRSAREAASHRMSRAFSAGVSALTHDAFEVEPEAADRRAAGGGFDRNVATVVGTEVHRLMEQLDLDQDLEGQLRSGLGDVSQLGLAGEELDEARQRLACLIETVLAGSCLERLAGVGESGVVARELPMILPPRGDEGPVGCVIGFADLVYRDPDTGELVVADYKTDAVADEQAVAARTAVYEPQIRTYARGLTEAMDFDEQPRCELWFLAADRIVVV